MKGSWAAKLPECAARGKAASEAKAKAKRAKPSPGAPRVRKRLLSAAHVALVWSPTSMGCAKKNTVVADRRIPTALEHNERPSEEPP